MELSGPTHSPLEDLEGLDVHRPASGCIETVYKNLRDRAIWQILIHISKFTTDTPEILNPNVHAQIREH